MGPTPHHGLDRRTGRYGAAGRLGVGALSLCCALAAGCLARAVPTQRWYVDRDRRVFDLVLTAIRDVGGQVVVESRATGTATGFFPEEIAGHAVYVDVTIEEREDEAEVRAETRAQSTSVAREDLDQWRQRFFDALDAMAGEAAGGPISHGPRATPPVRPLP